MTLLKRMSIAGVLAGFLTNTWAGLPNVIVFLVDDMGVMDTSVPFLTDAAGTPVRHPLNDWYRTPNMERLANQGIRFNNFYAQSVCSPTRASIMTGQNATRHGTTTWIQPDANNKGQFGPPGWCWTGLNEDTVTLPRVLGAAGYRTIHIGKAHFGPTGYAGSDPLKIGFDVNIGGAEWGRPDSYYGEKNYGNRPAKGPDDVVRGIPHLEKYHGTDTFLTEALTLEACAQLTDAVKAGKPFFLYMAHYAVHSPFDSDPRFAAHYADSDKGEQAQAYAALIEGMDKSLGDLLDQLEGLGVAENTLVLFLGDNGSDAPLGGAYDHTSSAPLRGKKATCFEGGMRVPFIAAWAKTDPENQWQQRLPIPANRIHDQLGTVMDLYPTLLSLSGGKNPAGHTVDGFDLAVQLSGKRNPDRPETFLMHFPHEHRSRYFTSYRQGEWKLVYDYAPDGGKPEHRLYNLKSDPYENQNLAGINPEKLAYMLGEMAKQLEAEHAQYPVDRDGNELKPAASRHDG
jgi:arylsulfatase A-like enzyme